MKKARAYSLKSLPSKASRRIDFRSSSSKGLSSFFVRSWRPRWMAWILTAASARCRSKSSSAPRPPSFYPFFHPFWVGGSWTWASETSENPSRSIGNPSNSLQNPSKSLPKRGLLVLGGHGRQRLRQRVRHESLPQLHLRSYCHGCAIDPPRLTIFYLAIRLFEKSSKTVGSSLIHLVGVFLHQSACFSTPVRNVAHERQHARSGKNTSMSHVAPFTSLPSTQSHLLEPLGLGPPPSCALSPPG